MIHTGNLIDALEQAPGHRLFVTSWIDEDERQTVTFGEFRSLASHQAHVFRNRGFHEEVVDRAIGNRGPQEDEVTVRGLYITIKEPTLWEAVRCFRRLRRARKRMETCEGFRPPTPLAT